MPLLLAIKTVIDAAVAIALVREQTKRHGALCFWCLVAADANVAAAPMAIPEARAALRAITG
jgi:hypothetical protein